MDIESRIIHEIVPTKFWFERVHSNRIIAIHFSAYNVFFSLYLWICVIEWVLIWWVRFRIGDHKHLNDINLVHTEWEIESDAERWTEAASEMEREREKEIASERGNVLVHAQLA